MLCGSFHRKAAAPRHWVRILGRIHRRRNSGPIPAKPVQQLAASFHYWMAVFGRGRQQDPGYRRQARMHPESSRLNYSFDLLPAHGRAAQ
jgi:hypothetical protein